MNGKVMERAWKEVSFQYISSPPGQILKYWTRFYNDHVNLGFVSPCIIIYSTKPTNQMHQSLSFIACCLNTAQHVLGILMSIIRSLSTAVASSGTWNVVVAVLLVVVGPAGPITTNNTATTMFQR
jgi:hypothetical protein